MIACDALATTKERYAFTVFERVFKEFGLPLSIRTDNGVPFASPNSFFGLSKLSVWWLRLGIGIERIKPAHPEQNGRHERMHLTLKLEATKPAAKNFLQQQGKFDAFIEYFNHDRPHQALGMKYPGEIYARSVRPYQGLSELEYPFHDRTITVTTCGLVEEPQVVAHKAHQPDLVGNFLDADVLAGEYDAQVDLAVPHADAPAGSLAPKTPSTLNCYPCVRNNLLPMCPEQTPDLWWAVQGLNL